MTRNARSVTFARTLVSVVRSEQLTFLAAAIAYYAFVSVVPLLLISLAAASTLAGRTVASQTIALLGDFLTPEAATLIEGALLSGTGREEATIVGLGVLLWSSLRVFRGLDIAFSRVYGSTGAVSLVAQLRDAVLVLTAIGLSLVATILLGAVLPLASAPFTNVVGMGSLVVTLTVVLFPLYYVFPDSDMTVREALPGAVLAAGGWTLLGIGFSVYASQAATFQLYGVIGGVLVILTWFYLGGLLLLLGAALNAVLAGQQDRQLQQGGLRDSTQRMSEPEGSPEDSDDVATVEPETVDYEDFAELRSELERFEEEIEDRTVHRDDLEADLKRYVRRRVRRGHARGWGPYLVLLYGTAMTLGAFYFLNGVWAFLAMFVIWLSTLGLYSLMLIVGLTSTALGLPGRIRDTIRDFRS